MLRPALLLATAGAALLVASCDGLEIGEEQREQVVCPAGATVEGVDVSAYQPNTDWAKVKAAGRDFAIIKATESTGYVNAYFTADRAGTKANGIVSGAYHFFRANVDPVAQADHFVQTVGTIEDGELPPTLDLETMDGETAATVAQNALTWLAHVEQATGRTPMVYTSPSFMSGLGNPAGFGAYYLWIAHWGVSCPNVPAPWTSWPFWQYTDTGTVNGISGNVDHDKFNGSLADLQAFARAPQQDAGVAPDDAGADGPPADAVVDDGGPGDDGATDGGAADDGGLAGDDGGAGHGAAGRLEGGCACAAPRPRPASASALLAALALLGARGRRRRR